MAEQVIVSSWSKLFMEQMNFMSGMYAAATKAMEKRGNELSRLSKWTNNIVVAAQSSSRNHNGFLRNLGDESTAPLAIPA